MTSMIGLPARAHDFWIQPSSFHIAPGQSISLRFLIGDPGAVEHWETEWRKVVSLQDFGPTSVTDKLAAVEPLNGVIPDIDRVDATLAVMGVGTHIVAFTSNQQLHDLPAGEFNAYAAHEGLTLPMGEREAKGKTNDHGRELYSRRAKTLIQVGASPSDSISHPIGQSLEIVPQGNPLLIKPGEPLRAQILFHGKPLAGASVVLEKLGPGAVHGKPVLSDNDGRVRFPFERRGAWKINVVWSSPIDDPNADYETIFCSLTFGM